RLVARPPSRVRRGASEEWRPRRRHSMRRLSRTARFECSVRRPRGRAAVADRAKQPILWRKSRRKVYGRGVRFNRPDSGTFLTPDASRGGAARYTIRHMSATPTGNESLPRSLGLFGAITVVVGITIGSGI